MEQPDYASEPGGDLTIPWDGSLPAERALIAALPALERARSVTLVQRPHASGPRAEDVAAYLSRHGIVARIERRSAGRPRRMLFGLLGADYRASA